MAETSTQKSPASDVDPGRPDIPSAGTRSKEVLDLQQRLLTAGFDPGPRDGIYGPRTADAVRRFQERVGLRPDGRPGPETARQLDLYLDLRDSAKATKGGDDSSSSISPTPSRAAAKATPKIVTDIWNREDQLGYAAYARALGALITHHETMPPLTIGIKAPWGAGKTSLMRMVQALLDGETEHTGMSAHDRRTGAVTDAGSIAVDGDWQTGVRFQELFSTLEKPSEPTERVSRSGLMRGSIRIRNSSGPGWRTAS
jgi:hypothetical protein